MGRKFETPYFVTRHAVERFREHIAPLSRNEIIDIILEALQKPRAIEGIHSIYYGGQINGKPFYIPVEIPLDYKDPNWPVVPTILGPESSIHRKIMTERRKRNEKARKGQDSGDPKISRQNQ